MPIIPGTVTVNLDGSESSAANSSTAKYIYEAFTNKDNFEDDNAMDGIPVSLPTGADGYLLKRGLAVLANRIGANVALPSRTPVIGIDYVVLVSDVLIAKTAIGGANDDITLPDVLKDYRIITIKDESGNCAAGATITIIPASGNIDGAANYVMNTAHQVVRVYSNGTNWFTL
ncbi:MAG: hypothetical protein KKF48_05775 [Nanoarchaeota archaeon]|nr:hypothetical protein [Nanoarchaeota archaeon]